jgi:hypothetical protein
LRAQDAHVTVAEPALRQSTVADYIRHLHSLRSLAAACADNSFACDPAQAGVDEHVLLANKAAFDAHDAWINNVLASAKLLPDAKRAALMASVEAHLDADLADVESPPATPNFSAARSDANAILAGREFDTSSAPSLRDRVLAILYNWLDRMLTHVAAFGSRSPWIGPLFEWVLGTVACALLLVWAFRTIRRQRVNMQFDAARQIQQIDERVLNWMREAEQHASRGQFRDAVHCLYWASIVTLEGRRLWQPDRARTPREYIRLLDPASPVSSLLRRQTSSFETIWYGLRSAARLDYDSALDLHRQLRSA